MNYPSLTSNFFTSPFTEMQIVNDEFDKFLKQRKQSPEIVKVIYNKPATIVYWSTGEKTVVKCNNENFSKQVGLLTAIAKYHFGNTSKYNNVLRKFCEW